jgi:hypothetical protein
MNNEMVRIGNDPESKENLSARVEAMMQDVAADYGGTKEDVARVVTYLLNQTKKKGFETSIKVPVNKVEEEILNAIAARFEARDIRPKMTTSAGEVLGEARNKKDVIDQARIQREAA